MDKFLSSNLDRLRSARETVSELYFEFVDMEPTPCKALLECAVIALSEAIHLYPFTFNLKKNG